MSYVLIEFGIIWRWNEIATLDVYFCVLDVACMCCAAAPTASLSPLVSLSLSRLDEIWF